MSVCPSILTRLCAAIGQPPPLIPDLLGGIADFPLPAPFDPTANAAAAGDSKGKSVGGQKLGFGGNSGSVKPKWMKFGGKSGSKSASIASSLRDVTLALTAV